MEEEIIKKEPIKTIVLVIITLFGLLYSILFIPLMLKDFIKKIIGGEK